VSRRRKNCLEHIIRKRQCQIQKTLIP
jgi:hypothetical protein